VVLYCPLCGAELVAVVNGGWLEAPVRCQECGLSIADPPPMLPPGPDEDEIEYVLDEWPVGERGAVTAALAQGDIPYRWEAGLALVVPAVAEQEVDGILDDLEADEGDDEDGVAGVDDDEDEDEDDDEEGDGGEEAQAAMADLFVAADRMQHAPGDEGAATKLDDAAAVVASSLPPYGIERPVWRRIQALAATVVADMDEGADEEVVATGARALRDFLRALV